MTTIDLDENAIVADEILPLEADDTFAAQLAAAYSLTPEQFTGLKVAERDLCLFLLLREIAGTVSSLETRINEYEEKAQGLATPEGMQDLMTKFMGGMSGGKGNGMGQLLAGMLR